MSAPQVWLLVTGDFVKTGGMDVANYMLARHLADRGHEVHLVAHRAAPELVARPGVHFHRVAKPLGSDLLGAPLLDWQGRRWARTVASGEGRVLVNGGNCQWGDFNWVHYVHAAYQPEVRGGWLRRLKGRWQHRLFRRWERRALTRARRVIANSHATGRVLRERLDIPTDRISVVYYGVEPEVFRPPTAPERQAARATLGWSEGRLKAVFIGALGDRRKGFDLLFEAWRGLCADPAWDVDLAVVGTGGELAQWQARAGADPALRERVEFLGFREDVPRVLAAADLAVGAPRYEAYGLGIREAICTGVPAIVSAGAGIAEQYPPDLRGALVPEPVDTAGLQAALRQWRTERPAWQTRFAAFGTALRGGHASWEHMAETIIALA